jgi:hypothetical protein
MPLRDHFRPPYRSSFSPEGILPAWPVPIIQALNLLLPADYRCSPRVHRRGSEKGISDLLFGPDDGPRGEWQSPAPTFDAPGGEIDQDWFEVEVIEIAARQPVAAISFVTPNTKTSSAARRAFVARGATRLREGVSVVIVDLVTTDRHCLYRDLLAHLDLADPALPEVPWPIYAVSCRCVREPRADRFEAWIHPLTIGQLLPTLPLWLAPALALPLDLEATYEDTCRLLRID